MDIVHSVPRYLFDQLMADLTSGHDIRATVYMECGLMCRADGPEALRCVSQTELVNGVAARRSTKIRTRWGR